MTRQSTHIIASSTRATSSSINTTTSLPGRDFPNPVAIFDDRFCFTTLSKSEAKEGSRAVKGGYVHPRTRRTCVLLSLDDEMAYSAFSRDYGPLNLAFTYAACLIIHEKLGPKESRSRPVCLYTSPDAETKSNMALMVALYFLIVRHESPSQCFKPLASFELMPFRDAGNGDFDHGLAIQDCLYGIHKAMDFRLLDLTSFDAREYQHYETPENGDLNILGPFIAFASPIEPTWAKLMATRRKAVQTAAETNQSSPHFRPIAKSRLSGNHGFKSVLEVFKRQNVGMVIRLNDELYDKRHFTDADMDHVEMYFDDGSNPSDDIIRQFIAMSERYIAENRMVAVHCRAGLGRTGVLIGAYLIYKYSFTAQEVIGYMRIVRPGMVVGPQQQFMLLNQMKWAGWAARDELLREIGLTRHSNPLATPPAEDITMLPRLDLPPSFSKTHQTLHSLSATPKRGDVVGQPRKTGPILDRPIQIQSPTPEPEDCLARNRQEYLDSTPLEPKEGSTRGIKRCATRMPIPTPSTPTRLGMDLQQLERSPSILSVNSANDRPRKRINGSPLAPTSPGLGPSSPPPTRESSPRPISEMIVDPKDIYIPQPTTIPRTIRKEPSSSRLKPISADHDLPPLPPKSPVSAPTRSFLPTSIRKQAPLREIQAIQAVDTYISSPSRIPRAVAVHKGDDKTLEGKEKKAVGKEGWTPPRLMSMFYNIGRSGTN